jgi:hypothetical protein
MTSDHDFVLSGEGVASFVEKRPATLGGLDPAFLVHGDRGY